jgi:hypothetical protein
LTELHILENLTFLLLGELLLYGMSLLQCPLKTVNHKISSLLTRWEIREKLLKKNEPQKAVPKIEPTKVISDWGRPMKKSFSKPYVSPDVKLGSYISQAAPL